MSKSPAFYEHNRDRPRIDPYLIFGEKMRKKERRKERGKKAISKRRKIEREKAHLPGILRPLKSVSKKVTESIL